MNAVTHLLGSRISARSYSQSAVLHFEPLKEATAVELD